MANFSKPQAAQTPAIQPARAQQMAVAHIISVPYHLLKLTTSKSQLTTALCERDHVSYIVDETGQRRHVSRA